MTRKSTLSLEQRKEKVKKIIEFLEEEGIELFVTHNDSADLCGVWDFIGVKFEESNEAMILSEDFNEVYQQDYKLLRHSYSEEQFYK